MYKYSIILLTTICQRTFFRILGIGEPTLFMTSVDVVILKSWT